MRCGRLAPPPGAAEEAALRLAAEVERIELRIAMAGGRAVRHLRRHGRDPAALQRDLEIATRHARRLAEALRRVAQNLGWWRARQR